MKYESFVMGDEGADFSDVPEVHEDEQTIESVFEKIKIALQENNIKEAEELRYKLFEIDSGAVHAVFESGQLIENAKQDMELDAELLIEAGKKKEGILKDRDSEVITVYQEPLRFEFKPAVNHFLAVQRVESTDYFKKNPVKNGNVSKKIGFMAQWFQFFNSLSEENLSHIIDSMDTLNCNTGKTVITKGKRNHKLFFLDQGSATAIFENKSSIKKIHHSAGDIIGDASFFSKDKSSCTVVVDKGSTVYYIEHEELMELRTFLHGIDKTIYSLCVSHMLRRSASDNIVIPRFHRRFQTNGVVNFEIFLSDGGLTSFKGSLKDISHGGFAFNLKMSNDSVEALQNKVIKASIGAKPGSIPQLDFFWGGEIININKAGRDLFSVHVEASHKNNNLSRILEKL